MTNEQIFSKAISQHPLNAGILREALTHYLLLIKNPKNKWNDGFINYNTWLELTEELKENIDSLYQKHLENND